MTETQLNATHVVNGLMWSAECHAQLSLDGSYHEVSNITTHFGRSFV